ncbi:unnamed protein product, partial [Prorocentrum cordatum]
RCVCTGADAAVDGAERAVAANDRRWVVLKTKCEVHRVYRWHEDVFDQIGHVVNRMRRIANALNGGDAMRWFRKVLRRTIDGMLHYVPDVRESVSWLGLMESVHGLLTTAFLQWSGIAPSPSSAGHPKFRGDGSDDDAVPAACGGGGDGRDGQPDLGAAAGADPSDAKRKDQSKHRYLGGKWLRDNDGYALGTFIMISKVIAPLTNIMDNYLRAGLELQDKVEERRKLFGVPGVDSADGRHALLAAENKFERQCFDEIADLMVNPAQWHIMPAPC